mmetsp:Transcript_19757/g.28840  ORF Transcript_19757/g.28840 Transcript_19757/m.28840 type:complete len:283 (+) Transcript_19757:229-1077(+)
MVYLGNDTAIVSQGSNSSKGDSSYTTTKNIHHWVEVIPLVVFHGFLLSISLEGVGKVQNGTRMAAIHDRGNEYSPGHGQYKVPQEIIVANLPSPLVVDRNKSLVVSVGLIAVVIAELSSVARVMGVAYIAGLTFLSEHPVGCHDVVTGGLLVHAIIHKDGHVSLLKVMYVHEVLLHVQNIIVTSGKFSILSNIVDTDENGTLRSLKSFLGDVKFSIDVKFTGGRELGNLGESLSVEHIPHLEQHIPEGEIIIGLALIGVADVEEGGGAGSTGTACGVGELER